MEGGSYLRRHSIREVREPALTIYVVERWEDASAGRRGGRIVAGPPFSGISVIPSASSACFSFASVTTVTFSSFSNRLTVFGLTPARLASSETLQPRTPRAIFT